MAATPIASLADLPEGGLRLVKAGDKRLAVVRTAAGVFALDNACPHEGYGLVQGELRDGTLTCHWHNWKFRVADGACLLGEEAVRSYPVRIEGDAVLADLSDPAPEVARRTLLASLRRGLEENTTGRIAREVVRLLRTAADPAELVWEAVAYGAPRAEFGWGHALASATDCLAMTDRFAGDERAYPIVAAMAGISEVELRRPRRLQPTPERVLPPDAGAQFRRRMEAEDSEGAEALVLAAIEAGATEGELRPWFVGVVGDHHLSYGHGAIYTQKAFELLQLIGWDRAATVLPHLVPALAYGTREDKLPYARPFAGAVAKLDLDALTAAAGARDPGWRDEGGRLREALLGRDKRAPAHAAAEALREGAGVEGVLDGVALAASERLLRHDPATDFDFSADFGWLDITHALTYANAARWAWRHQPGRDALRLAFWTVFLVHYSGRHEWRQPPAAGSRAEAGRPAVGPEERALQNAVETRRPDDAVAAALALPALDAAAQLERAALADRASSFIMAAHFVKTARAAGAEAESTGSSLPLAGTARFMASPKLERFVARNTAAAIDLVSGRGPAGESP